jgi:pSer/pThr/pTyr-binding forkhead associated (FHA) protein
MMRVWVIGGGAACDIVVDSPTVSARHCRLTETPGGFLLEDLGSTNGTFVNGVRIAAPVPVTRSDVITLGRTLPMPWPSTPAAAVVIGIGREADNELVVNLPMVSGHHARVLWEAEPGQAVIEDLGSANGTAIGAPERKITRSTISASDTIYLGSHALPAAQVLARLHPSLVPRLVIREDSLLIGRDPACDRVIDLPMISSRHARLVRRAGSLVIEDLASANGTFVNGRRVDQATPVTDGDTIGLGSHTLVLVDDSRVAANEGAVAARPDATARVEIPGAAGARTSGQTTALQDGLASTLEQPWRIAILVLQAPLLAIAIAGLAGALASSPADSGDTQAASRSVGALLFGVSLAGVWFGLSDAVFSKLLDPARARAGEGRGAAGGLVAGMGILGAIVLVQCGLAWAVAALAAGLKAPAMPSILVLFLASAVGLLVGLVIVSLAPRPEAAWGAVALAMLICWALGGGQGSPTGSSSPGRAIAAALPSRWAFEGLLLLESDQRLLPEGAMRTEVARGQDLAEAFFPAGSERMGTKADTLALGLMVLGLTAAAAFIAARPSLRSSGQAA